MTLNVKIFKYSDTGAPVISGANSLVTALDAILVNGYNSHTITSLSQNNGIATANINNHGYYTGQCLLISGATPSGYNGEVYVLSTTTNSFTYTVDHTISGTATGTITSIQAPAGWTLYNVTSSTQHMYQMSDGSKTYLGVSDTGTTNFATIYFSLVGSYTNNTTWAKSSTTDSTARKWLIAATGKHLFYWCDVSNDSSPTASSAFVGYMGDLKINKNINCDNATLIVGTSSASAAFSNNFQTGAGTLSNTISSHYLTRSLFINDYTASDSLYINANKFLNSIEAGGSTATGGGSYTFFPDTGPRGMILFEIDVGEPTLGFVRGILPGIWASPYSSGNFNNFSKCIGAENFLGKTFIILKMYSASCIILETSNTWDT